jgi:hypothetical protein
MQSACLAGIEPLGQIMRIPKVQIPYLRTLDAHDAEKRSRWNSEEAGVTRRSDGHIHDLGTTQCLRIQRKIRRRQRVIGIANHRRNGTAGLSVVGGMCHGQNLFL